MATIVEVKGKADAAVTDPDATAGLIPLLKGILKQLQNTGSGYAPVSLATRLTSEYDTVDIDKMSKGGITVAHDDIVATATSEAIDCRGFNSISLESIISAITAGNWTIKILGCATYGGTYSIVYDDAHAIMQLTEMNVSETHTLKGVPNYIKIEATRTTDGTLTCTVTPMNL